MRTIFSGLVLALCIAQLSATQVDPRWKPNDPDRPVPPVIESGTASTQDTPGRPPSDAVVLFGGKDLDLRTSRVQISCRLVCRITATRCASGIFGSVS
jgi:hypothetical protein